MEHMSVAAGGPKRKQGWEGRHGQDGRTDTIGGVGRANIDGRGWIGRTQMAGGGKYISKFYQLSEPLAVIRGGTLLHCGRRFGSAIFRFLSKVKYQSGACPLLYNPRARRFEYPRSRAHGVYPALFFSLSGFKMHVAQRWPPWIGHFLVR